jgi:hypothetical protein
MKGNPDPDPIAYEKDIYQRGLKYERPPFTFDVSQWETLATSRLSAEARGYVYVRPLTKTVKHLNAGRSSPSVSSARTDFPI